MIPFLFMEKDTKERKKIVNDYYTSLVMGRKKIGELDDWCRSNLRIIGINNFKDVVTAELEVLNNIKKYIDKNTINFPNNLKTYIINTLYEKCIDKIQFAQTIEVTVCPYCNRNFINASSKKKIVTSQIDHFFNKSQYSIMAVSFYNLIPVCPSCNRIKSIEQFSYSPYDDKVHADELLRFSFEITDVDFLNHLEVVIAYQNEIIKDNISILGLDELYKIHYDVVKELIEKKLLYVDEYVYQMGKLLGKDNNLDEISRLITGGYTQEKMYGKRPLSKLITDISKEIDLI